MSEATEAFLEACEADLQKQLGRWAALERLVVTEELDGKVTLVATLRTPSQHDLVGTGENLVAAYARITHALPELVLATTYRQVLEQGLGA